jgi:hypothetical protein
MLLFTFNGVINTHCSRDGGVSLGRFINFLNPPLAPFSKVGLEETQQQRLWPIENLIKVSILYIREL